MRELNHLLNSLINLTFIFSLQIYNYFIFIVHWQWTEQQHMEVSHVESIITRLYSAQTDLFLYCSLPARNLKYMLKQNLHLSYTYRFKMHQLMSWAIKRWCSSSIYLSIIIFLIFSQWGTLLLLPLLFSFALYYCLLLSIVYLLSSIMCAKIWTWEDN